MKIFWALFNFFLISVPLSFAADESSHTIIPGKNADDEYKPLVESFQEGSLQLYDIPVYLKYLTEQLIWLAGLLAVIVVMIGGYKYLKGGFDDSTDEGKNTIANVAIGLAFIAFAWMIIDLIIRILTE